MKRISKKVREEAILICDVAASWGEVVCYDEVAAEIGMLPITDAEKLACRAYLKAYDVCRGSLSPNGGDAEAAQLLREGWTP